MSGLALRQAPAAGFTPTPHSLLQRSCSSCGSAASLTGKCSSCESEERFGVRPKLAISRPGDLYEQEADRIADEIVSVPDAGSALQRPREDGVGDGPTLHRKVTPLIQREAAAGPEPDEDEGVPGAETAQRQAEGEVPEDDDDRLVQPRRTEGAGQAGPAFQARLDGERGGGAPLDPHVRAHMEARFGVDLDHVRVHTGSGASRLAKDIQAEAFTLGSHVYFGAGYYDPSSRRGRHLLAHELVHTIQQRRGDMRPVAHAAGPTAQAGVAMEGGGADADAGVVQRNADDSFVPERLPSGELVHQEILQEFGEANPALFTEVNIPGATSLGLADKAGRADFYMDVDPQGRGRSSASTPAVLMLDDEPKFLSSHRDLRKGGARFSHKAEGAPRGRDDKEAGCDSKDADVCRVDKAPRSILLADLKPPPSLTNFFGGRIQLGHYDSGIAATSKALNKYIQDHPTRSDPAGATWTPTIGRISQLKIPTKRNVRSPKTMKEGLRLYNGRKEDPTISGLVGHLAVYKSKEEGIWNYEWIPQKIPAQIKTQANSPRVMKALERLNGLVKKVRSPPAANQGGKKPLANAPARPAPTVLIQRKDTFDAKTWPAEFKAWQDTDAKPLLGGKAIGPLGALAGGATPESEEGQSLRVLDSARDLKSRLPAEDQPADLQQLPARPSGAEGGYGRMRLWARWGALIGRLRGVLGTVFVKIADLYETAKEKFEKVRSSFSAKNDEKPGSIPAAIISGAFKVAGAFFKTLVSRVTDNLKRGLKQAAIVIVEDLIGEERMKQIEEAQEDFETVVGGIEAKVAAEIEKVKDFTKPFTEIFEFISDVRQWTGKLQQLVSAVRWGLRIINCLTPPGVGCLKLLLQEIVEMLAAKVIASCWFTVNFIKPLMGKFDFFKELPGKVSGFILDKIKWLVGLLPIKAEVLDKAFAPPKVSVETTERDLECEPKTITPAQREMNKLLDDYGREYVLEMIKLLEAAGLSDDREMTLADVALVRGLLDKVRTGEVTKEQIETAVGNLKSGGSSGIKDIDATINQLSGLSGGGSGGGGPGSGRVKQLSYEQARTAIPPAGGDVAGAFVKVIGSSPRDKAGNKVTIGLAGLVNGKEVVQITGVPAEVTEVRDEILPDGKPYRRPVYRIASVVLFTHDVPGVGSFVAQPSRPIPGHAFPAADAGAAPGKTRQPERVP